MSADKRVSIVMYLAAFLSVFDRSTLPPLVPEIAADYGRPIDGVGGALTAYVISYAVMQLLWSVAALRWGRVRVVAVTTAIAAAAAFATALAVEPVALTVWRAIAGGAFAATVPAVLVYLGDTLPMARRAVGTANLATMIALGITAGTLVAALAAQWVTWRLVFGLTGLIAVAITVLLLRSRESAPPAERLRLLPSIALLVCRPWAWLVLGLGLLQGIVYLGAFNFLTVALQVHGEPVAIAGAVTAAFGVTVIVTSQAMKLVLGRVPSWLLLTVGGGAATLAFALAAWRTETLVILLGSVLTGTGYALAQTTVQTWMTDVVPGARVVGMAFFATAFFGGGSIGTAFGGFAAVDESYPVLFTGAAVVAAVIAVVGGASRARYRTSQQRGE